MDIQRLQERLNVVFERNFEERDELGASVSVWFEGQEIVSLAGGFCDKEKAENGMNVHWFLSGRRPKGWLQFVFLEFYILMAYLLIQTL